MRGVVVEVSAQRFGVPYECTCCGAAPNAEVPVLAKEAGPTLLFPYCLRCVEHARNWDNANVTSTATMVLGIVAAAVAALMASPVHAVIVFVLSASAAWWLRIWRRRAAEALRGESCASAAVAVESRGWSGSTNAFTFESPTFAARFAEENKRLLANVSPSLQRLVDGYHRARLAVPTPAVAAGVAPPPLNAREWIARVESTEGALARRVQLQRALEMIEDAGSRRELLQTVARLELEPVIARLSRLASPGAKKQLLESTILQVDRDNIPEQLQTVELQVLRARLAEL